jgi:hypothetical protein
VLDPVFPDVPVAVDPEPAFDDGFVQASSKLESGFAPTNSKRQRAASRNPGSDSFYANHLTMKGIPDDNESSD